MGSVWYRPRQVPHHHDFNLSSDNDIWLAKTIIPTNNESCESYHYQNTCLVTFNILSLSFFRPFLCSPDNRKKKKKNKQWHSKSPPGGRTASVSWFLWSVYLSSQSLAAVRERPPGVSLSAFAPRVFSAFQFFVPRHIPVCSSFLFFWGFFYSPVSVFSDSLSQAFFFLPAFFCCLLFLSLPFNFWTPALWIKRAIWFLLPCCAAPNMLKQVCIESNYIQNNLGESRMGGGSG